jgi:MFS family permease
MQNDLNPAPVTTSRLPPEQDAPTPPAATTALSPEARREKLKAVFIVSGGNFLEMYDFMVFGYYASAIARTYFPSSNEYTSLMLSLMTFGAGFLMRPLGAVLLGGYVDRHGRRKGLLVTLALMAAGTLSIAFVPGYAAWGLAAPLIVLAGRLVQGFSAGAEVGGVSVYLSEIATPGRKGFYVAWQSASQQAAVVFAASMGLLVTSMYTPAEMLDYGWRIPLIIGCVLIPFVFVIRRSLKETDEFKARRHRPTAGEMLRSLGANWRVVLLGMLMVMMTTVSFYLLTAYTPTYGTNVLRLTASDSFLATLFVGLTTFVMLPTMGAVSDRVGRRPLLIACSLLALATAYPALSWLVAAPSFGRLLVVELWLAIVYASYNGAMFVYLTEIMPTNVRATGFSLAYSLAVGLFGGFTPAICTYLIHITGNRAMPAAWLAFAAGMSLIAVLLLKKPQAVSTEPVARTGPVVASTLRPDQMAERP